MAKDEDIERLLREAEALTAGPRSPVDPQSPREPQSTAGSRSAWLIAGAAGGAAAGGLAGTVLAVLPFLSPLDSAVGAAVGGAAVALVTSPPRWFTRS